jgi:uncharacterized membrane protein
MRFLVVGISLLILGILIGLFHKRITEFFSQFFYMLDTEKSWKLRIAVFSITSIIIGILFIVLGIFKL